MKKLGLALSLLSAFCLAGLNTTAAQGRSGAHGGRPNSTGLEHAESTANLQGISHGIENAEAKQAAHKKNDADQDQAATKHKKHHKKHKNGK